MRKYETLKEKRNKEWKEFERTDRDEWKVGESVDFEEEDNIDINDFCPTSLCNLFHADDMAEIFIRLKQPFIINHWSRNGRDSLCQVSIKEKNMNYIKVAASGYGLGDWIEFSKGFPDKLKFEICREMAIKQNKFMEKHNRENIKEREEKRMREYAKGEYLRHKALWELLYSSARSLGDLKAIAELYHLTSNKSFYDKYGKETIDKKSATPFEIKSNKSIKKSAKEFKVKWSKLIKSKLYREYQKAFSKVKAEEKV